MSTWPTLNQWFEFGGTLLLELLILFAVAKLVSMRLRSAQWRRHIWQIILAATFLVAAGEMNGVRGLIRLPEKKPPVASTRAVIVTITDAELPPEAMPLAEFAPSLPPTPQAVRDRSPWQQHAVWPGLLW